jgi:hypothetical protein
MNYIHNKSPPHTFEASHQHVDIVWTILSVPGLQEFARILGKTNNANHRSIASAAC